MLERDLLIGIINIINNENKMPSQVTNIFMGETISLSIKHHPLMLSLMYQVIS